MDDSESLAREYLTHMGFERIVFEPEGCSKFPDFLVEDRIAVEVRSLNEQVPSPSGAKPRGRDAVDREVVTKLQHCLLSLGPSKGQISWYVDIEYDDSTPPDRQQMKAAISRLRDFRDRPIQEPTTILLSDRFALKLHAGPRYDDYFVMGKNDSDHSGILASSQLEINMMCIEEKTKKAHDSGIPRTKYAEWWLVLIDRITYGESVETIRTPSLGSWHKVILVNPLDSTKAIQIPR